MDSDTVVPIRTSDLAMVIHAEPMGVGLMKVQFDLR